MCVVGPLCSGVFDSLHNNNETDSMVAPQYFMVDFI